MTITENDLHYLRSILGHLRIIRGVVDGLSLGAEVLADNIDWLDCFIDRATTSTKGNEDERDR